MYSRLMSACNSLQAMDKWPSSVWLTTCFVAPKPFVSITAIPAFQISEEEYATFIGKRGCVGGSCCCWIRTNVSRSHQRHRRRSIGGDGRGGDSEGHERGHRRYADH